MKPENQTCNFSCGSWGIFVFTLACVITARGAVWVSGPAIPEQAGIYGTKGTAAADNIPGARREAISWIDANDQLWIFGGYGFDSNGMEGALNDLWKFNGQYWIWVSGSQFERDGGSYGIKGVPSTSNMPKARHDSVSWIDANGNLWLFGGMTHYREFLGDLWKFDGNCWTWVGGSDDLGANGVYGTKGVPSGSNIPGSRLGSVSWSDASGNFWLFGGVGRDGFGHAGILNDLWKYDGTNWTWVSGSDSANQNGVYGIKGVAAASNMPGARAKNISWRDTNGNLWLFGGGVTWSGTDYLNDLWKFDGANWTWVSGWDTVNQTGIYGTKGIAASTNVPGARGGSISWTDKFGNFWLFGGTGYDSAGSMGQLND